jgi:hypothetical protein
MAKVVNLNIFALIGTLLLAAAVLTLATPRLSRAGSLPEEIRDFQRFLNNHPKIAADLQRDPGLANNRRYLSDHDTLREYLHDHPKIRRELAVNPGAVWANPYGRNSGPYYGGRPYSSRPYYGDYRRYDTRPYGYEPRRDRPWWRR